MRLAAIVCTSCACGRLAFAPAIDGAIDAFELPQVCPDDARLLACWSFDVDLSDATGRGNDVTPSLT